MRLIALSSLFLLMVSVIAVEAYLAEVPDVGPSRCVGLQSPSTLKFYPAEQLAYGCDNTCFGDGDAQIPCDGQGTVDTTDNNQEECTYSGPRNCNAECADLPSYPTYEKEDCITACVETDQQDRANYDNCVAAQSNNGNPGNDWDSGDAQSSDVEQQDIGHGNITPFAVLNNKMLVWAMNIFVFIQVKIKPP